MTKKQNKKTLSVFVSTLALATGLATFSNILNAASVDDKTLQQAIELRELALTKSDAYSIVESLTVEVGPRMAASEGDKKAVAWAMKKLTDLGFDRVYKEEVKVPHWTRGNASARITAPFAQNLLVTALGGSVGTGESGIHEEVVMFATLDDLKKAEPSQVKGKIAYIAKKTEATKTGRGYGASVGARSKGAVEAAKKGAKALIIRSVGTDSDRFPHTGLMRYSEEVPRIPAAAISNPDADMVEAMFKRKKPVKINLNMDPKKIGAAISHNVVAEIRGRERPEEIVLISAHLDSWDLATGALDDGAGVAIVTEAARIINSLPNKPKRTVRVVLFAAEEIGLIGAHQYMLAHKKELANHIVAAESDFGAGPVWRFDHRFPEGQQSLAESVLKVLKPLGVEMGSDKARGGPDVSILPAQGVPVVALYQNGEDYFDYHHTPNDTLDKIDPKMLQQNVAAWVSFVHLMANFDGEWGRLKKTRKQ